MTLLSSEVMFQAFPEVAQAEAEALVERTAATVRESDFPRLDALRPEALPERRLTVESCDNAEREMRTWLQGRIDAEEKRLKRLGERIIDAMRSYLLYAAGNRPMRGFPAPVGPKIFRFFGSDALATATTMSTTLMTSMTSPGAIELDTYVRLDDGPAW